MFKKLQKEFILIYSISIFILLTGSFAFILGFAYFSTYSSIKARLDLNKMNEKLSGPHKPNPFDEEGNKKDMKILSKDIFFFVDDDLNVVDFISLNTLNEKDIQMFEKEFKEQDSNKFQINSNTYVYTEQDNVIKVIDITDNIKFLYSLLLVLIIIEIIIICLSVVIGYFFSSKSLKYVKSSYEQQATFISDASHEIKTPISVISSCLDLIKNKDNESEKWINYCIDETKRLEQLTSTLLKLSEHNSPLNMSGIQSFNVSNTLELMLCAYEVKLFEQQYQLSTNIEDNLYIFMIDDDFKQLFHILIDNSIKYNTSQKLITITLIEQKSNIIFEISNSAAYISENDINKLFDRFYRNDVSRNKKINGFGLGLSQAKKILDKYDLKYNVKYSSGSFSFKITFNKYNNN